MSNRQKQPEKLTAEQRATVNTGEQHQGNERSGSLIAHSLGRRFHSQIERQGTWRSDHWLAKQPFDLVNGLRPQGEREDCKSIVAGARASSMGTVVFARLEWLSAPFRCLFWTVSLFTFFVPKTGFAVVFLENQGFLQIGGQRAFLGQSKSAFCQKLDVCISLL